MSTNGGEPHERGCALVTGASRGIGVAIAEGLAADGWPVGVVAGSDLDGARAVARRIEDAGGRALALRADVADPEAVDAAFSALEEAFGPVLVVANNAGVRNDRLIGGLSDEDWSRVLAVNLTGTFNTTRRAMGQMVRARFGRIVNIGSIAGTSPLPGQSAYAASKAAVEGLTRAVAIEVARRGVTVNAVAPGLIDTGFLPPGSDWWVDSVPAKRHGTPEEVAAVVRFLARPEAQYVNGSVVRMDGGLLAGIGVLVRREKAEPVAVNQ